MKKELTGELLLGMKKEPKGDMQLVVKAEPTTDMQSVRTAVKQEITRNVRAMPTKSDRRYVSQKDGGLPRPSSHSGKLFRKGEWLAKVEDAEEMAYDRISRWCTDR